MRGLILHDKVREVFERSLQLARESGYLKGKRMKVALDTTNILGRGAVKDTYNLLSDGIVRLARALAQLRGVVCSFDIGVLCHVFPYLLPHFEQARISGPYPCGYCIPLPCTTPTLCYHIGLLSHYISALSLKARIFPSVESGSAAIADGIDVPVCFVGPNERFESS